MSNETKHTPGPWDHSDISRWGCVTTQSDGHGDVVAEVGSPPTGRGRLDPDRVEETKANARLIAAAPEMLAALVEAAWVLGNCEHLDREGCRLCDAFQVVSTAIAKARGGGK